MTEHDPLRTRFETFRDRSDRTAIPPTVEEIPRRLRKRRQRRTVAALLAAAVLVALVSVPVWWHGSRGPTPTTSPTPIPDASASSSAAAIPAATAGSVGSTAPSSTSKSGGTCSTDSRGLPVLPNGREAVLSTNDSRTMIVSEEPKVFDLCPAARIPFTHVTYDWDIDRRQYVLIYSASYVLTRAQPTLPMPPGHPVDNNACGWIDVLMATTRPIPTTIPRSVQDSSFPDGAVLDYLQRNAFALPYDIFIDTYDNVVSHSYCVPPPSPTPSTS